jgi:hypothetical protein
MSGARGPRRATFGAALMGLACLGATTGATLAQGNPGHHHAAKKVAVGSDLGAVEATASSSAVSMPLYSHQGEDVDVDIPYSLSTLGSGGVGQGLASVLYPGPTGASGGDVLTLLGVKAIPTSVQQDLNDPEIAEAQSGVGASTVSNSHPGLTMTATATSTNVSGTASSGGAGVPVLGSIVGTTDATSSIRITGPRTVTVNATSSVHNISIDKVVTIAAVTSTAHAVTDGHAASGSAITTVSGVKIAGVSVRIDNKGVHVLTKKSLPTPLLGNTAATVVNKALKSSGIHFSVTATRRTIHHGHAILNAGALVVALGNANFKSSDNDTGKLLTLGGASIDALATPGFPPPKPIKPVKPGTSSSTAGSGRTAGTAGTPGTAAIPGTPTNSTGQSAPVTAGAPVLAGNAISLPKGLGLAWVIVALAGAGLFAFGMKRLPDQVLRTAGKACRLEGES